MKKYQEWKSVILDYKTYFFLFDSCTCSLSREHCLFPYLRKVCIGKRRQAIAAFRNFSKKVALILLSKREVEIKIKEDQLWEAYFDDDDIDMVRARNGCPLRRQNDHQYSFIHKSFLEYFVANGILDIIATKGSTLDKTIKVSPDMITQDQGVVSFFRDAFELDPTLTKKCFERIEESKGNGSNTENEPQQLMRVTTLAAAAITLLNTINFDFTCKDLRKICIPNANLSYGNFEKTNFKEADLTNVNFASACLRDANFKRANLKGVNFGEWPYLQFEEPIRCISFSGNGKVVAAAIGNSTIIFEREVKSGKI